MPDELGIAIRVAFTYLFVLALVRLVGKRTLGQLSFLDFVATVIVSDVIDNIVWLTVPVANGVAALTTIALLHILVEFGAARSERIERLLNGGPVEIIHDGHVLEANLRREYLSLNDVWAQLRLRGLAALSPIKVAYREMDGQTSILRRQQARPVERRDLPELEEALR